MITKLARIGNSHGLRIPKKLIIKYQLDCGVEIKETEQGLLIKAIHTEKLSWNETFKAMEKENENWDDWDAVTGDKLD